MSKVLIDRAVVEQALATLRMYEPSVVKFGLTFKHGQDAIAAISAALEQPQVEQEPVAWQRRMRTKWMQDGEWWPWQECSQAVADDYKRAPVVNDWEYESRALYTHPQNLSCKSNQARLAMLWGYIKEQPQQEQEWKRRLGNLLAVIHGDGGHYIEAHGWDKAQADAEERVARVMTGLPQSASVVWPRTASEVRAFLSGHVAAERYARDDHQPDDSDTYTLSAHDLLGAIYWWTDFDPQPRQPLTDQVIQELADEGVFHANVFEIVRRIEEEHGIFKLRAQGIGGEK